MKKGIKLLTIVLCLCIVAVSFILSSECDKIQAATKNTALKLNYTNKVIYEGDNFKIKVKGTNKKVKWYSSDKSVATVSSKGVVKGVDGGNGSKACKIIALVNGKKYKCKVVVKRIELNCPQNSLYEGETVLLTLSNPKAKVSWSSSDSKAIKVSEDGIVTGLDGGNKKGDSKTCTISATVGKKTYTCEMTVQASYTDSTEMATFEDINGNISVEVGEFANVSEVEIKDTIDKIRSLTQDDCMVFGLITDLHSSMKRQDVTYSTAYALNEINKQIKLDSVYLLGDIIIGDNEDKNISKGIIKNVRKTFSSVIDNFYILVGNHDNNNNNGGEVITRGELHAMLGMENSQNRESLYYYHDYDKFDLRVICLDYFGWNYNEEQISWLKNTALDTTKKVIVLCHSPFSKEYDFASNGNESIKNILNDFTNKGGKIVGVFHGHNHWDYIGKNVGNTFTEISTTCAKFENNTFNGAWYNFPQGAVYPQRNWNDYTRIAFDIVIVDFTNSKVSMIRCGSGSDRAYSF